MMNKVILTFFLFVICLPSQAQDAEVNGLKIEAGTIIIPKAPEDTLPYTRKTGVNFNMNANQGSLSNWSAGGDKLSISINAYLNLFAFFNSGRHTWDNNLDLAFGTTQTTSLGRRKSSDRIDFTTKYGYTLHPKWYLTVLYNARSQFANGYAYSKDELGKEVISLTSRSFQPTFMLLSSGIDYKPLDSLSIFISPITSRWVIVSDATLRPLYGVPLGSNVRCEKGAFISANYRVGIGKKFSYKSKLDLFSNYKTQPGNIDIFWTNVITASITRFINFSLNVDMIYDDNTKNVVPGKGPAPQWLQLMGIGFAYKFVKS